MVVESEEVLGAADDMNYGVPAIWDGDYSGEDSLLLLKSTLGATLPLASSGAGD